MRNGWAWHRPIKALVAVGSLLLMGSSAFAQVGQTQSLPQPEKLLTELLALLVVVTILESAMSTIFQWRVYRMLFNARAVKTVFMVAVGWAVVNFFSYDIFSRIVTLAGVGPGSVSGATITVQSNWFSNLMSALVLAGGSSGINSLLKSFGFRSPVQEEAAAPPLKEDEAWISISVLRKKAIGGVNIHVDEVASGGDEPPALLGVLDERSALSKVKEMIFAARGRVPSYGGRKVKIGPTYRILATGQRLDSDGAPSAFSEEIYYGRFASRAVIDLVVTI